MESSAADRTHIQNQVSRLDEAIAEVELFLRVSSAQEIRSKHLSVVSDYLVCERRKLVEALNALPPPSPRADNAP